MAACLQVVLEVNESVTVMDCVADRPRGGKSVRAVIGRPWKCSGGAVWPIVRAGEV